MIGFSDSISGAREGCIFACPGFYGKCLHSLQPLLCNELYHMKNC